MSVMLEYNTTGIILTLISVIGLLLLYKKTVKTPFLLMGLALYIKLLFCSFGLLSEFVFVIPEFILSLWLVFELKTHIKWIITIIIAFSLSYVYWVWYSPWHITGVPAISVMTLWVLWYFLKYNKVQEGSDNNG